MIGIILFKYLIILVVLERLNEFNRRTYNLYGKSNFDIHIKLLEDSNCQAKFAN